ncbi:hypothetical protein EG835_04445 [bacterium]|nr:hypothetical protein [bacterium]
MNEGNEPANESSRRPEGLTPPVVAGFVVMWHRAVSSAAAFVLTCTRAITRAARDWASQWKSVWAFARRPANAWSGENEREREVSAAAGVRAFALGLVLAGWWVASARNAWIAGVTLIAGEVLWASARFIIIAWLMPRGAIDRRGLSIAFCAGLLPYVAGVTAPLRVAALVASAYVTWSALRGAGVRRADADRAIGWSFGGQAGVAVVGWFGRALLALLVGP